MIGSHFDAALAETHARRLQVEQVLQHPLRGPIFVAMSDQVAVDAKVSLDSAWYHLKQALPLGRPELLDVPESRAVILMDAIEAIQRQREQGS